MSALDAHHPSVAEPEPLRLRRVLLLGSGALSVSMLPFWINWTLIENPELEIRCVLTEAAASLVSARALSALTGSRTVIDAFGSEREDDAAGGSHWRHRDWAEGIVVAPASLNTFTRIAAGAADTPAMLAIAIGSTPVCVAPSLPPGAYENSVAQTALAALTSRPGIVVVAPTVSRGAHEGSWEAGGMAPMPQILRRTDALVFGGGDG